MFNMVSHQGNANQNHSNEIPLDTSQLSFVSRCICKGELLQNILAVPQNLYSRKAESVKKLQYPRNQVQTHEKQH